MNESPKFAVDCADHEGYLRILTGEKKILTRAMISTAGDYSQTKEGDIIELADKQTGQKARALIKKLEKFRSVADLYATGLAIAEETFNKKFSSERELRSEYEGNRPGYTEQIDEYGLVVWRIELV